MQNKLKELAEERQWLERQEALVQERREALWATDEYQLVESTRQHAAQTKERIADLEREIREAAMRAYADSGDKQVANGVVVKVFKVLQYDADAAFAWCRENAPAFLKLDTARFRKGAQSGALDGAPIEIVEEPRAQIARDLSEYLE